MNVLFLYTELAEYFLKCCESLSQSANVSIVRWPVNKEAPFEFETYSKIKIYNKNDFTLFGLEKLIREIKPDIIICSGWIDKDYLKLTKPFFNKIPTVLTCDTHWLGSPKQYLALILSRFFLLNVFSHAWVPGKPQFTYVRKLGFKKDKIEVGYYCCDLDKFNAIYKTTIPQKKIHFPKRFVYIGRYYDFKGLPDLWKAFIELDNEENIDWELWCLGTGNIKSVVHPKIKHFGFVQPKDLANILIDCGIFVLPSRFEPWGVVVHEMAAAGFPLILSGAVGAKEVFLKDELNGFVFVQNNVKSLKMQLKKIILLNVQELVRMAEISHLKAQEINPESWVKSVLKIYNGGKN